MPTPSPQKTARLGALAIASVWLALAGVLYLVFERIEQKRQASLKPYALSSGDLVIPRQRDGIFMWRARSTASLFALWWTPGPAM